MRTASFHWLTATCMEMTTTQDSQPVLSVVDLWLIALKAASSEQEFQGFYLAFSASSFPKEISRTFPFSLAPLPEA